MSRRVSRTRRRRSTHQERRIRPRQAVQTAHATSLLLQRAVANPSMASASDVLALQSAYGNRAVSELVDGGPQPRLIVGPVDDAYEREAERTARRAAQIPLSDSSSQDVARGGGQAQVAQRQGVGGTQSSVGEPAQRGLDGAFAASPELQRRLATQKGGGSPLPEGLRSSMESRLRADLSGVRVHQGNEATELSGALGAEAFTHGQDIYFRGGALDLQTPSGRHLLAHELTHTVQQGASNRIRGWWPAGHRLVTEMAIQKGGFGRFYDPTVLAYLVDRSPDVDFVQDQADTMNRGIAESKGKIKTYKSLRKNANTRQQAIDMYGANEIHTRRPAYMLSHGEAGQYKEPDASVKNAAVTKRLVDRAIGLWLGYQHGEGMSVLSDALHQAEDRGSHGEGNEFTEHDARLAFDKYPWEKRGIAAFKTKIGDMDPSKWAPDNASVNQKGLVLGVGFGQGVLEKFRRGVRATERRKVAFPETALKQLPKKRKMSPKWFLPKMTSGATMVGAVGKTAKGVTRGGKRETMSQIFEQAMKKRGMDALYELAKQIPKEEVPRSFQDLLEEGVAFYELGAGLLQSDPVYSRTYRQAKAQFQKWGRSRLRGGLKKSERRNQAKAYYLTKKLAQRGRARAATAEAIKSAYRDVFGAQLPITKADEEKTVVEMQWGNMLQELRGRLQGGGGQ